MSSTLALGGISHDGSNSTTGGFTLYSSGWQFTGNSSAYKYVSGGTIANTQVWHHACCTVADDKITTYLDGVQVTTNTLTALGITATDIVSGAFIEIGCDHPGGNEFFTGYVNDFRVYDHALSAKEVKEIAKGLVVHFPLSRGVENILSNTNINSIDHFGFSEQTGGSTKEVIYDNGVPCVKITRNSTAHSGWAFLWATTLQHSKIKTGTTYTVSFDAKASTAGSIGLSGFMNGNATNQLSDSSTVINGSFAADTWTHLVFRTTTKSSFDGLSVGGQCVYMSCGLLNATGAWLMTKNFKVEEGTKDTPWVPASTDTAYSVMGYNNNIEYDCSGYKYNGTKSGTITYTADTPRYFTSTNFGGVSYITNNTSPLYLANEFTIAWWGKINSWKKNWEGMFLLQNNTNLNAGLNTYDIMSAAHASSAGVMALTICQNGSSYIFDRYNWTYTIGNWAHYACTYKNGAITMYQNGISIYTETITNGSTNNYYYQIGRRAVNCDCNMSDFRIYATALSAEDIKELYNATVSIANNGTMLT